MIEPRSEFRPLERLDGYLPIEDHGLVGDGTTAALVGRDGAVGWLCAPRFDSTPLFAAILDRQRGGHFAIRAEGVVGTRQYYVDETGVLVTEQRVDGALLRITDALVLRADADLREICPAAVGALVRRVEAVGGDVSFELDVRPRGGAVPERTEGGWSLRPSPAPDVALHLSTSVRLESTSQRVELRAGEGVDFHLRWDEGAVRDERDADTALRDTARIWRAWTPGIRYDGPRPALVRRSVVTLKLLDHFRNGAIVAAPTASLPEGIGGERNWDYRFTWVRDAAFSVYALRRVGMTSEADAFLRFVMDAMDRDGEPKIMYGIDGGGVLEEFEAKDLEGYRRSSPVRFGNAAADQKQNDVFGEIVDCAYQWATGGEPIPQRKWARLERLIDRAAAEWDEPDHGIWEVRSEGRVFTYSAAMCHVALERGARLAERFGFDGDVARWRRSAEAIRRAILEDAWSETAGAIAESFGGDSLDASTLTLPMRRVLRADHPKMVATTAAIAERLGAGDGLLYRYLPDESPDGLEGEEGAFLLCSFWLVDNLTHQGRLDEAHMLYDSLCDRANPLGLLPEQIDPADGRFLGNFPQAFSHIGVIASGFTLGREEERRRA
jgi:alpha,alpha-trehalase